MPALGQLFTSGSWLVKSGKEQEFISAWKNFAEWTSSRPGTGIGHLLQDIANPRRFLSFGPWESQDAIQSWRNTAEFQTFLTVVRDLCEDFQPSTLSLVALSPSPSSAAK